MNTSDSKTVELVQRAVQGDQDAFTDLFHSLNAPVLNYIYRMVGDRPTAEDVTQDAFIRAHQRIDQLGPPWDFKSWVYRIAGNLAIDHLRQSKRFVDVEEVGLMGGSTTRRPAERKARMDEQRKAVWKTLDGMPTKYRQALILREFNDLSYKELSSALEVSYDAARQIVHRARMKFKDLHGIRMLAAEARHRCRVLDDMLSAYRDGELPESEVKRVRKHISRCEDCQASEKEFDRVHSLLAVIPPLMPTAAWQGGVLEEVRRMRTPRQRSRSFNREGGSSPGSAGTAGAQPASLAARMSRFFSTAWPAVVIPAAGLAGAAAVFLISYLGPGAPNGYGGGMDPTASAEASAPAAAVLPGDTGTSQPVSTETPSPTPTSTNTATPTLEPATALGLQNVKCRRGPDMAYMIQTYLLKDDTALITGRNENDTWWQIDRTDGMGRCWVWDGVVEVYGDLSAVPFVAAPATYTPTVTEEPADTTPPDIKIDYSPSGYGHPHDDEQITFRAYAEDNEGLDRIEIWLKSSTDNQLTLVQTCSGSGTCSYTGGPYASGMLTYQARAYDLAGNEAYTSKLQLEVFVMIY